MQVVEGGPRDGDPIVLIHCFSCAIDWWDGMRPRLEADHRVVAVDLLGHGGSEKPGSGYTPPNQAKLVAEALRELHVRDAEVVGHSLGGAVSVALAEQSPRLVNRVAIIDMPPDDSYGDLGFIAGLAFQPILGEALWTIKPDFSVRDGLEVAFAPGFDVPDAFVDDVKRLTYTAYDESPSGVDDYFGAESLDRRMRKTGKPLMVLMGAEEQIVNDPQRALDQYANGDPGTETHLDRRRWPLAQRRETGRDRPPRPRICQITLTGPRILGTRRNGARRQAAAKLLTGLPFRASGVRMQTACQSGLRPTMQPALQPALAVRGPPYLTNLCSTQAKT